MHAELEPLGLRSLIFEYGYFVTEVFGDNNMLPYNSRIEDYAESSQQADAALRGMLY